MKKFKFKINEKEYEVDVKTVEGSHIDVIVNGKAYAVEMEEEEEVVAPQVSIQPDPMKKPILPNKELSGSTGTINKVLAPLPGNIFKIEVSEGTKVKAGTLLLIMESMKMENNITSEVDGVVKKVSVAIGQAVMQDDLLIEIES